MWRTFLYYFKLFLSSHYRLDGFVRIWNSLTKYVLMVNEIPMDTSCLKYTFFFPLAVTRLNSQDCLKSNLKTDPKFHFVKYSNINSTM